MKYLKTLMVVMAALAVVTACDSGSRPQPGPNPSANSPMQLPIPTRIRNSQAIDPQQMNVTITIDGVGSFVLPLVGDRFEGTINVPIGTQVNLDLEIYEQVGNDRIIYATMSDQSLDDPATTGATVTLFATDYFYPDDDNDGATNLAEREAGSDHRNAASTPTNPDDGIGAGQLGFADSSSQVEEGEQVQLSVIRSSGTNGVVTANIESSTFTGVTIEPSRLMWNNGDATSKIVTVRADSNFTSADSQTIQLRLTAPTGGATLQNSEIDVTIRDITIVAPPPFATLETDGEWEVCAQPYNTSGPSPFATQSSQNEDRVVKCFKPCTADVILDQASAGVAWMPFADHSCFLSDASPLTYANAPVYTPRREQMELNLSTNLFINTDTIWGCDTQNRANATYTYVVDDFTQKWYLFNEDGTYGHAITTDGTPPSQLRGPAVWSVNGRVLELSDTNTGYRNVIFFGNEVFHIHPDTDERIRCTKQSY